MTNMSDKYNDECKSTAYHIVFSTHSSLETSKQQDMIPCHTSRQENQERNSEQYVCKKENNDIHQSYQRYKRFTKRLGFLNDYVCTQASTHWCNLIKFTALSSTYHTLAHNHFIHNEPKSYREAQRTTMGGSYVTRVRCTIQKQHMDSCNPTKRKESYRM